MVDAVVNTGDLARLYRSVYRIRRVEEAIARVYPTDRIQSPVHLSIGQEAVAVGVCDCLAPEDVVYGTYRGHAMYLAKGGDLRRMIAELYGRADGCARGKGGSMHLIDREHGVMGTSAVVASTIPLAVGHALAFKQQRSGGVAVAFFGDGATEEGVWHESLNFASVRQLPVLFICENNRYAIHSPLEARQPAGTTIAGRAAAYGMPTSQVDSGDLFEIREQSARAVAALRAGQGPWFLECATYRWREHVGPGEDFDAGYRRREEAECWQAGDPLVRLAQRIGEAERARIHAEVDTEVTGAFEYAERCPFPAPEALYEHVA